MASFTGVFRRNPWPIRLIEVTYTGANLIREAQQTVVLGEMDLFFLPIFPEKNKRAKLFFVKGMQNPFCFCFLFSRLFEVRCCDVM